MFTKEQVQGFSKTAESLKKYRRAELLDETGKSILDKMYVDLLDGDVVLNKCLLDNTTFLIGRKGTGKSTIFLKLEYEYRKRRNYLPCYIDVKTVYEASQSQSSYVDYLAEYMDKETLNKYLMSRSFIRSVLSRIYEEVDNQRKSFFQKITETITGKPEDEIKEKIDKLKKKIENNQEFQKIELPVFQQCRTKIMNANRDSQKEGVSSEFGASLSNVIGINSNTSAESALESEQQDEFETEFAELFLKVFEISSIIEELQNILKEISISHLVIMLDDVSEIDDVALKMFIDTIVAPLNNWSNEFVKFKVAFYPNRIHYGKIDPGKIDIINLDFYNLYSEFDVNKMEENAIGFTRRLIDNRFSYYDNSFADFIDDKFEVNDAYALMFKTSMNVPRIMGYLLSYLHQSNIIYGRKISKTDIENASVKYYDEKIDAFFKSSTYCLLSLEERRDIAQLNKLKTVLIEKSKEIKTQITTGELSGKYVKNMPFSSHFHVLQDVEKYLTSLELNHFISKYEEMSNRDGKKVNVYCLNYGLAKKNNIYWGKPNGSKYRKYYIERPFNYTNIVLNQLKEVQIIHCTNNDGCGRKFLESELPFLQFYHFKCPDCGCDVIVESLIDSEIESDYNDTMRRLTTNEMSIVLELKSKNDFALARDLSEEVDMSSYEIGRIAKKLTEDGIVQRRKNGQLYEYSLSEYGKKFCE